MKYIKPQPKHLSPLNKKIFSNKIFSYPILKFNKKLNPNILTLNISTPTPIENIFINYFY